MNHMKEGQKVINYEQWCKNNQNVKPIVRALKSSMPEQYIGFYLQKALGTDAVEYQKQFDWLGKSSLDFYIPSLQLAIEYDGFYYHAHRKTFDSHKTSVCRSNGVYVIRIIEQDISQSISKKINEISYYCDKKYTNIDIVIATLFERISKKYDISLNVEVNLNRDEKEIISYIQEKYYKKTIAYVWPESRDYWLEKENGTTIYDVFYTDNRCFVLRCPHCKRYFKLHTRYIHHRKSLIPCECERKGIENDFKEAIISFKNKGELITFDDSLRSRRLYDRMNSNVRYFLLLERASKEELIMYKELGFDSPNLDYFLSKYE